MARQWNYIPGTLEWSTTSVCVQEARAELTIIQVSAESHFTALAGQSGAAAQCLLCADQPIPYPGFWTLCHGCFCLFVCFLILPAGAQKDCTTPQRIHHWLVCPALNISGTEPRFGRRLICVAFETRILCGHLLLQQRPPKDIMLCLKHKVLFVQIRQFSRALPLLWLLLTGSVKMRSSI